MTMFSGTPAVGTLVVTNDGKELGRVKEISGACFKVDAPMQPDYWLATDSIRDANQGPIVLRLNQKDLNEAKMNEPEHTGVHKHML